MSSPSKMLGCDDERAFPDPSVSYPPKMLGLDDERPSGPSQSCPPKMLGAARDLARRGHGDGKEREETNEGKRFRHVTLYNSPAARRSRATRARSAAGRKTFTCGPKTSTQFASSSIPAGAHGVERRAVTSRLKLLAEVEPLEERLDKHVRHDQNQNPEQASLGSSPNGFHHLRPCHACEF
jgi:hypothetical protein